MTENDPIPVQSNAKKAETIPPVEGPKALSKITPRPRLIETIALWVRRHWAKTDYCSSAHWRYLFGFDIFFQSQTARYFRQCLGYIRAGNGHYLR